jgi:hypothetical protein
VKVIIDNDYIMSCVGTMASKYPEASWKLMLKSIGKESLEV